MHTEIRNDNYKNYQFGTCQGYKLNIDRYTASSSEAYFLIVIDVFFQIDNCYINKIWENISI